MTARFEKGREPAIALGLGSDPTPGWTVVLRNIICLLLLAEIPIEIPCPCRILAEIVNDIAVPADPERPAS